MEKITIILGTAMLALFMVFIVAVFMALPTMFLWNFVVPDVFGLPSIGVLQSLCLNILCGILFRTSVTTKEK